MPTFNRNDTNAILAFFGQTSTGGSTQPRDEEYYTSNDPPRPSSNNRPRPSSSNVVTPTTTRRPTTVPRDEAYYTSQPLPKPKQPVKPPAPKVKRNVVTPMDVTTLNSNLNQWRNSNQATKPITPLRPRTPVQGPQPRPEPNFIQRGVDQWQAPRRNVVTPFQGYDVTPTNVDYARPTVNTGTNAVQPSGIIGGQTVRSPIAPRLPAYGGPADDEFYTQRDAPPSRWTPGQPPIASSPNVLPVIQQAWDELGGREGVGNLARWGANRLVEDPKRFLSEAMQGVGDMQSFAPVWDTAAVERAQRDIADRNQQFSQRERSTWSDLGQSFGNAWDAMGQNNALIQQEAGEWWRGEQPLTQALTDYASNMNLRAAYEPAWTATDISRFTANTARQTNNLMSGLQGAQDLVYNQPWLPNNRALSDYMTPLIETVQNDPNRQQLERVTPEMMVRRWGDFWRQYSKNFDAYQQAITPDAEQAKRLTPSEAQQQADRARLRSLAGSEFVGNVFDKLVNQQQNVDNLNQQALTLFQQGAQAIDEDLRQELWQRAAQLGADAYQLKNSHPIQLVNEGFSWQELAAQLVLPDVTDLAGGLFSVLQLTPKARRLTSTIEEVMTPQQQAVQALQEMIVTPATRSAMQAQRSDYNKLWNLWTTGNARANIATDKMVRYVVNLLGDAETPGDARLLLTQLATDPTKLVTGMAANVFQSPGLLARANEKGLVQFGAMNLNNLKEPLRVYQQAAENILNNSTALATSSPVLDKLSFVTEFMDGMKQAGYRFYNVADDAANVPLGTKTTRLRAVTGGQYVVEWVDGNKKVIGASEPMLIQDARKLQNSFKGGQVTAPQSVINKAGSAMRKVVSIPFILGNPGTWVTNAVSGVIGGMGDGVWSTATNRVMDEWKAKVFGIDPTVRGLEGAATGQGFAQNAMGGGVFSWLRNKYSQIDENAGRRVWHASAQHALRQAGKTILQQTLAPILQGMGITNARQMRKISNHLFEVGYRGGDMVGEWARLMTGNARVFSLSDTNPQWLGALSEPVLEQFYDILKTATTKEDALTRLQAWTDSATKYWDDLLDGQQVTPQRHVWMKKETAQDAADLTQTAKVAQKYGGVSAEEAAAWTQQTATAMQDTQRRMETLMQLIAEAKDPKNRYALYNAWGQITDLTADVRGQLLQLAEKAGQTPAGAARQAAWGQYWTEARRLWDERNTTVNTLLEQTAQAVTTGQDFTPHLDVWKTLERSAQTNEAKLWETLRLEPQGGAYDQRLRQVIDAGRQIADKSMARVYAAARRFSGVDAMDYIISAEKNVQTAGGQARAYLDKVLEKAIKSGKWEDYYSIRNEVWRQLRTYERDVWGLAERNIVRDGLGMETSTGLRFDAGPDGAVELVRPDAIPTQKTNRLGTEKGVTTEQKPYWVVKREDGTITQVPDSMVPQELKDRYSGVEPAEIEAQTQLELDNIASAEPFSEEAQQILNGPDIDSAPSPYAESQVVTPTPPAAPATPPPAASTRITRTEADDLRRLANDAGIQTATEDGKPMGRRLLNTLNKDLGLKLKRIEDLPPDRLPDAVAALEARKAPAAPAAPAVAQSAQNPLLAGWTVPQVPPGGWRQDNSHGFFGWKIHVDSDDFVQLERYLKDKGVAYKIGKAGGQEGKGATIYIGGRDDVMTFARQMEQDIGSILKPAAGKVLNDDIQLSGKTWGRFTLDRAGGNTWHQYGGQGIPYLRDDQITVLGGGMPPAVARRRAHTLLSDVFDEYYLGTGTNRFDPYPGSQNMPAVAQPAPVVDAAAEEAMYAEEVRRLGLDTEVEADPAAAWRAQVEADAKPHPPVQQAPVSNLRTRIADAANVLPTGRRIEFIDFAKNFTDEEWPQVYEELRKLQDAGDVVLIPLSGEVGRGGSVSESTWKYARPVLGGETPKQIDWENLPDYRMAFYRERNLDPTARTYELSIPLLDYEKWARENVAKSLNLGQDLKPQALATTAPTTAGDLGQGAAFAKQQIQNIYNHVVQNLDEILTPYPGIGQGQSLRAIDEFRTRVLPAWDNAKYIASEYGNRMRSFTMVDFANNTRLDELLSLYMPYGFWMTRTAKNSLERAIFEPHIWRRVMQTEQGVRDIQEQRGDPQRYEGAMPYDDGSGIVQYLRLLPSKYWQATGIFTHNDYADPESANSALGFAVDSLRAANLNSYPWFDIAGKLAEGNADDLYLANYLPQGRLAADLGIMLFGQQAAQYIAPGYFENSVARVLNNMAVKGEITKEQARWAHDLLWQQKQGGQPLPEQSTVVNMEEISAILDTAMRTAAGNDLQGAASSWLTGASVRPFDTAEKEWTGAAQEYYENQFGPQNPYGSHLASQAVRDDATLAWSKSGVWKPEEQRPGQMLVNDLKKQEKETINQDLMSATDAWLNSQKKDPTNGEINDFKTNYIAQTLGADGDYYGDMITDYLEDKYPSAQPYQGGNGPRYKGYAPEEIRESVRVAAYYQAKEDIADPVYPGDKKSAAEYKAYYDAKAAYEDNVEARVEQLINDPQWLAIQSGTFLRTTRTAESEGSYRLIEPTLDNAFGVPVRPTGNPDAPTQSGLIPLAGSPETAADIILGERTKYMSEKEKEVRARNEAKGDRSRRVYSRNRVYPRRSSSSRRRYSSGGGGYRRSYGGGGGGGSYFANVQMPDARGLNSSLWSTDQIREWRPWNNNANDWLYAGKDIGPERLEEWQPLRRS